MVNDVTKMKRYAARHDFFTYAELMAPDFYKSERRFLVSFAETLEDFMDGDNDVLIVNMPPRHGKSRTMSLFSSWLLGRDNSIKIMTASYNERLATQFAKNVRNTISTAKADDDITVFSDIFPETKVSRGDASMNLWSLDGGYSNYLATSPTGTATGFGARLMIIDDLIKNSMEAMNERVLDDQWDWFANTMLSRIEGGRGGGGKLIIVMTRWSSKDLAGRALELLPERGYTVQHVNLKALQDDGTMLDESILSRESYDALMKTQSPEIASANYQQEPIDLKGGLYKVFKTYEQAPEFIKIWNYTDTADTGNDYHTSIVFGETRTHQAYILDVIHTQEPMSVTERLEAEQLDRYAVNVAKIEYNNGGAGFERQVMALTKGQTVFRGFHQSNNKEARIYSNASWVEENVYYPSDWANRFPSYYKAMQTYQANGKNKHDDAPDATTGIAETLNKTVKWLV